jgi:4-hydroxy-4-methyl-2-oxoglutarate aldolase
MSHIGKIYPMPSGLDREFDKLAAGLGVATVAAAIPDPWGRERLMDQVITRVSGSGAVAGRAVTAWNPPGTNTMVRFAIEACEPGDILVMTTPTDGCAQWGDLAHEWATARGLAGVIVDGAVRDVDRIHQMELPIWSRSVDPRQALKSAHGYVNAPIRAAGVRVCPGDLVIADGDGVLVVPLDEVGDAITAAQAREAKENESRKDLSKGQVSPHMAQVFDPEGIQRMDLPWNAS